MVMEGCRRMASLGGCLLSLISPKRSDTHVHLPAFQRSLHDWGSNPLTSPTLEHAARSACPRTSRTSAFPVAAGRCGRSGLNRPLTIHRASF